MSPKFSFTHSLNSGYLFENFVAGRANQVAHAAALQVANSPEATCNPLYLYGGEGVGKTHLIQAIGNQFKNKNSQAKTCYVHARTYASDVVRALQANQLDEFRRYYNTLDLLLIDDIQFIARKIATQQEFFDTLNSLIDAGKHVVITGTTVPANISGLNAQLASRFAGGLTVAIEPPDMEMRVAILLQKSAISMNPIGEDVAFLIAQHVRADIRKLKGALNRVEAYARFHNRLITVDLVNEAIADLVEEAECMQ